jgi:hypothetical protein
MLLIHGARSALRAGMLTDQPDDLRAWALDLKRRKASTLPPSRSPTNSPESHGETGRTNESSSLDVPPGQPSHSSKLTRRSPSTNRAETTSMANRADRRGDEPITNVSPSGRATDRYPTRDFPSWPGPTMRPFKGRRYDCSRPSLLSRPTCALQRGSPDMFVVGRHRLRVERVTFIAA